MLHPAPCLRRTFPLCVLCPVTFQHGSIHERSRLHTDSTNNQSVKTCELENALNFTDTAHSLLISFWFLICNLRRRKKGGRGRHVWSRLNQSRGNKSGASPKGRVGPQRNIRGCSHDSAQPQLTQIYDWYIHKQLTFSASMAFYIAFYHSGLSNRLKRVAL